MRPAILAGSMRLPIERVNVAYLRKTLTIKYRPMGEEEPLFVEAFSIQDDYIHVPRQFGLDLCAEAGIDFEDDTSLGIPVVWPPMADPLSQQTRYIEDFYGATQECYDFLARAHTGFGKSYSALAVGARLGVSTLIVVDQENLKDQWLEVLTGPLCGMDKNRIGLIQGKECRFEGCIVTIAMVQTLSQKTFPDEVYNAFGYIVFDECHIVGAPTFSIPLMHFAATYRVGTSATPKRRDGLQKLIDYNLGAVRAAADATHDESSVYFAYHPSVYSFYATVSPKTGRFINEVSEDAARNLLGLDAALFLYDTGRDSLLLSDRIEHLRCMADMAYYAGIPEEDLGLYTGYDLFYRYAKEATPLRRPPGWERGTEYTPVSLQLIAKKIPKAKLALVKTTAKLIYATYGKFAKGVDEPRLSGGVDLTPRSRAEQVHGRILRRQAKKLKAIWITIADDNCYRSLFAFASRIKEYVKSNARLYEWKQTDGGLEEWHVDDLVEQSLSRVSRLKQMSIVIDKDGRYTLVTKEQEIRQRLRRENVTASPIRSLPRGLVTASSRAESNEKSPTPISNTPLQSRVSLSRRLRKP